MRGSLLIFTLMLAGCGAISPELIERLSQDDASMCIASDIRGGAGSVMGAGTGGYGQSTQVICRSKFPNAKIEAKPDGSISIQHGEKE